MSDADVSKLPERQKEILELIRSQGYVATEQLVRQFGVELKVDGVKRHDGTQHSN